MDGLGNKETTKSTTVIKIDKKAPTFSGKSTFNTTWYNTDQTSTFTYVDT